MPRIIRFFCLAVVFVCSSVSTPYAAELNSNVIVLFDFSNSYFTPERLKSRIPNNIKQLSSAISDKREGPKVPSLIQVLPINTFSEVSGPICEYKLLRKKLLGGKKKKCGSVPDSHCSKKRSELREYIKDQCAQIISSTKSENATDISGSLALASQLIEGQSADDSYIIIFSDMFEFRVKELPVSKINLNGARVLVVCGGFFNNETDSTKLCFGTQSEWRSRLEKVGASSVVFTTENVRWADGLAKDFF